MIYVKLANSSTSVDITAPLYWWKEFEYYFNQKYELLGSDVFNLDKEFTIRDFSCDRLMDDCGLIIEHENKSINAGFDDLLSLTIQALNFAREKYILTGELCYLYQITQLLPESYYRHRVISLQPEALFKMKDKIKYDIMSTTFTPNLTAINEWTAFLNAFGCM